MNRPTSALLLMTAWTAAGLAIAAPASATLLTYEGFDDKTLGAVHAQEGGIGWKTGTLGFEQGWRNQSNGSDYTVADTTPLSYGSLVTSPDGQYMAGGGSFRNVGRQLDNKSGGVWDSAGKITNPFTIGDIDRGGLVWVSLLIRKDSSSSFNRYAIGFSSGNVPETLPGNVSLGTNNGATDIFLKGPGTTGDGIDTGKDLVQGQTNLWVLRFDFNGSNSSVHAWVNPAFATLGGPDLALVTADVSLTGLTNTSISFRNLGLILGFNSNNGAADEIRFGTTYASVTPVPEPASAVALLGLGAAALVRRRRA